MKRFTRLFGNARSETLRDDASRRKAARRRQPALDMLEGRMVLSGPSALPAPTVVTLAVTSSADNASSPAQGTLRWAILEADAQAPGTNVTIELEVPAIYPTSPLPALTVPVTIDGTGEQASTAVPVVLDGSDLGADGLVVDVGASGSVIKGVAVGDFLGTGIFISGASNVQLDDDFVGVEYRPSPNGYGEYNLTASPNLYGIVINGGSNNVVSDDVVSGNDFDGIDLVSTSDDTIEYSDVGAGPSGEIDTDAFGHPLGNGAVTQWGSGIYLSGATSNTIANNVIVDSGTDGVLLNGSGTYYNTLSNNQIGVGIDFAVMPNPTGVVITGAASYNTLSDNSIGGNSWDGVAISGSGTYGNALIGNWIGVDPNNDAPVPNWNGVQLLSGSGDSFLYQNVIAGNYSDGVYLEQTGYNDLDDNWVGICSNGVADGNGEYGIILVDGATGNFLYANNIQDNAAGGLATFGTGPDNGYYDNYSANNGGGGDYIWD